MTVTITTEIEAVVVHQTARAYLFKRLSDGKVTWAPKRACERIGNDNKWKVVSRYVQQSDWAEDTRERPEVPGDGRAPKPTDVPNVEDPRTSRRPRRRTHRGGYVMKDRRPDLRENKMSQLSRINMFLNADHPVTIDEIETQTGITRHSIISHVNKLRRLGLLEKVDGDWTSPNLNGHATTTTTTDDAELRRVRTQWEETLNTLRTKNDQLVKTQEELAKTQEEKTTLVEQLKEKLAQARKGVQKIVIQFGTRKKVELEGMVHERFDRVLQLAKARKNIFLFGPTGCGKSYLCEQLATALELPFYFVSCTSGMSEGVLGGRLLPVGKSGTFDYVVSEFIKAYENGGVFLLDEIDAADSNVLLFINAALASKRVAVPNRPEKPYAERHENFVCVAAANTCGKGASRMYTSRNELDAATLDRFQIGKIELGYDERVEEGLCPDEELRARLTKYREAIDLHRLERAMSTRFMLEAYEMKTLAGWTDEDIDRAYFTGWREDEVAKVKSHTTA